MFYKINNPPFQRTTNIRAGSLAVKLSAAAETPTSGYFHKEAVFKMW